MEHDPESRNPVSKRSCCLVSLAQPTNVDTLIVEGRIPR